jgi:hypothetical protein
LFWTGLGRPRSKLPIVFVNDRVTIGEKIGAFLKNQCYDQGFAKFGFVLSQKRQFFRRFFAKIFFKS